MSLDVRKHLVLILAILFFCLDFYFRIAPSLIIQQLIQQYAITTVGLSSFASLFFIGYLLMQIPAAAIFQRYPTHWILLLTMSICPLAFIIFIYSHSLMLAYILRFIMGMTAAFSFIAVLYIAKQYFLAKWFGLISAVATSVGTLSSSLFAVLSSELMQQYPWRITVIIFAILCFLASLIFLFIKLKPTSLPTEHHTINVWRQVRLFLSHRVLWLNALVGGLFYLPTSLYDALWGISFMQQTYAVSKVAAATGITLLFVGWAVGSAMFGVLSSFTKRTGLLMVGAALLASVVAIFLVYVNIISVVYLYSLLFLFGMFSGAQVLVWRIFIKLCAPQISNIGIALTNMIIMLVIAIFHWVVGHMLSGATQINFHVGFAILPLAFIMVAILSMVIVRYDKPTLP